LKHGAFQAIAFYEENFKEFQQAKAMHKEEIKIAFSKGEFNSVDYFNPETKIEECVQYYNETFGGEE
jgi:uncharacterized glyoxalase superfamily protein PhnB